MKIKTIILLSLLIISPMIASASGFDIVRPDKEAWVCVDYAVNHTRSHDGYITVSVSNSRYFYGESAAKSVHINEDNSLNVYEAVRNSEGKFVECEYVMMGNWYDDDYTFYHFYPGGCRTRNYRHLMDNRWDVLY